MWSKTLLVMFGCFLLSASSLPAQQQPAFDPRRPDPAYELNQVPGGAVLLHKPTGDSWWLLVSQPKKQGNRKTTATWLPMNRVEDYGDVAKWLQQRENASNRSVIDLEIKFAAAKLKEARSDYGLRHPIVVELSQDLRELQKTKRAIDKQRAAAAKRAAVSREEAEAEN